MPTSRIQPGGSLGLNIASFEPYNRISISAAPFEWFEAVYSYTEIKNRLYSDNPNFSGNQTLKDKGFDFKFRLLKEKSILPEVSVGFRDIGGTGLFSGEYIVANKQFSNIDFSLGLGWGLLSDNRFSNPLIRISDRFENRVLFDGGTGGKISASNLMRGKEVGIFGGIEYFIPFAGGLRFIIERDSINYQLEAEQITKQDSNINYGFRYPVNDNFQISLSYIRGNELSFGFSFKNNFNKNKYFTPKEKFKRDIPNQDALKRVTAREKRYMYRAALKYFNENDLSLRSADLSEDTIEISFSQNKFVSYPMSYGRAFKILDQISPDNVSQFVLIPKNAGFETSRIEINRDSFNYLEESNNFRYLDQKISIESSLNNTDKHEFKPKAIYPRFFYSLGPELQTHIGGPERFFIGGLNYRLDAEIKFQENINIILIGRYKLADQFNVLEEGSNSILPKVRTDVIEYLKGSDDFSISRLQFNYFKAISKNVYSKLGLGIFEEMFGGFGGEILYRNLHSNWALGAELYHVKQRDYDVLTNFRDYETLTGHITYYYHDPSSKILFKLHGGRYLAKDSGVTFDFSRRFKSGTQIGAFFSLTDISNEEFGEGSFDKGFYFSIPLQYFLSGYTRRLYGYGLRPTTRDGAAKLITGHELWGITEQMSRYNISRDADDYFK